MDEVLHILYNVIMSKYKERKNVTCNKSPVEIVRNWCESLDLIDVTQRTNFIHIAGTKGKGSTAAFCESIMRHRGYKTGLYTSPNLYDIRERIRINGKLIKEDLFVTCFWKLWTKMQNILEDDNNNLPKPGFFRFMTLLCFQVFKEIEVDVIILEVGIGGRLDSTNVIERPLVTGITTLDLDHVAILGNTLEEIAVEKCGIFKAGVPAVVVDQASDSVHNVFSECAEKHNVEYIKFARKFTSWHTDSAKSSPLLGLQGDFQTVNASLALELCNIAMSKLEHSKSIAKIYNKSVWKTEASIKASELHLQTLNGLANTKWPGRCQTINFEESNRVFFHIDGAHTPKSMTGAVKWYDSIVRHKSDSRKVLVFYCGQEREAGIFLRILHSIDFSAVIFIPAAFEKPTASNMHPSVTDLLSTMDVNVSEEDLTLFQPSSSLSSVVVPILDDRNENDSSLRWQITLGKVWSYLDVSNSKVMDRTATTAGSSDVTSPHTLMTPVYTLRNMQAVIEWVQSESAESKLDVLITGSLYIVGDFLKEIKYKL